MRDRKKSSDTRSLVASMAVLALLGMSAAAALAQDESQELPAYTLDEVAEHADRASCWLAIEGRVYNVTDFISDHPTPAGVLLEWCGKEATEGWRTKGYGNTHSSDAEALLARHMIGALEE